MLRRRIYGDTLRRISEAIETAHKDLFGLKEDRFLTFVREHKRQLPVTFLPVNDPTYREFGTTKQVPYSIRQSLGLGWQYAGIEIISDKELMGLLADTERLTDIPYAWIEAIPSFTFSVTVKINELPATLFIGRRKFEGEEVLFVLRWVEINQRHCWSTKIYRFNRKADDFVSLEPYFANEPKDEELLDEVHIGLYLSSRVKKSERERREYRGRTTRYVPDTEILPRREPVVVDVSPVQREDLEKQRREGRRICLTPHRAAHIRRAHWKRVWCGPMTGPRWQEWRWIAPTFISGF